MSGDPDREGVDATRLARAVRTTTEGAALGAAPHREPHRQTNWLRDVILGGQDGLVNILGIVLGVIAAGGSNTVLYRNRLRRRYHGGPLDGRRGLHVIGIGTRLLRGAARPPARRHGNHARG